MDENNDQQQVARINIWSVGPQKNPSEGSNPIETVEHRGRRTSLIQHDQKQPNQIEKRETGIESMKNLNWK